MLNPDPMWLSLKEWLDASDPLAWGSLLELALRDQEFRLRLRQSGATDKLIVAYSNFKDMLLRRSVFAVSGFRELQAAILEGERRDYLDLAYVSVPIEQLLSLMVADIIQQFKLKHAEGASRTDAERFNDSGWDLHATGREPEALEWLERSIRLSPRFCPP